jgi:hypothetical protein
VKSKAKHLGGRKLLYCDGKIAPSDPAGAAEGTATAAIGIKARKVDNMMPSRQEQVQRLLEGRNSRQAYNIA